MKCVFDESSICVAHGCVAEKVNIRVSKFKKEIGFYKETVIKLKCSRLRTGGSAVSEIENLKNPKWPPGGPKMADGIWKGVYP